jgi:23S rRNA (uracil1939-C5)-methyltransferase
MQEQLVLTIHRLGIHGEGISSWEGLTIFVDGALPGEVVKAAVVERKKSYARAKVLERLETAPTRVQPICPVFGRCGGCQLMHLEAQEQLKTKRQRVIDALERIGKLFDVPVLECIPSPKPLHYRNKIQLPVKNGQLGLYAFNSHDLVEIDQCFIHCELGEKAFQVIKHDRHPAVKHVLIKTAVHTQQILVVLVTADDVDLSIYAESLMRKLPQIQGVVQNINPSDSNTVLSSHFCTIAGHPHIEDVICGLRFKVSPASFFQVNPAQAENLYRTAIEFCELTGEETVLDGYCGVGTLSLLLAQQAKKVVGIESVSAAIQDANENAKINQMSNVSFICTKAEKFSLEKIDVAVINPPRKGCEPEFLSQLALAAPSRIIYISCDPATLARDLSLLKVKGYRTEKVQPFDMFPQTMHVESIAQIKLMNPKSD